VATEFNYVVNVDTSRVMGAMSEVRSQMGQSMMPQGPTGVGAVVGGAAAGMGAMTNALVRYPVSGRYAGLYNTFTDPAMAYTPHYGAVTASTTPGMERLVDREGLDAAQRLRPPGVSAADFYREVQGNRIERENEAKHQAFSAARTTLMSGAGGLVAGSAASSIFGKIGGALGGKAGTFGRMAGSAVLGLGAFMVASDVVGGAIQEHYASIERIGGVTRELGEILGAGKGLSREERYNMGQSARRAASELNMDVQGVADVLAGARQMGMLPKADNPKELQGRIREFVQAIDEGAQMLGTSMGNAMRVVKGMTGMGFSAQGGVEKLVGMAGAAGISPMAMYGVGMAGAGVAKRIEMGGRAGFDTFTQGVLSAAGAGLSKQELGYVGGVTGLGQQIAMTQMGHAVSPMGDMQLMAMSGGGTLASDPYQAATQALGMLGKGGDFIGNAVQFDVHKRELREGLGAKGMQTMTRQAIMGQADMLMSISPNTSQEEAFRYIAKNQYGMSSTAAMGMYKGTVERGGGGGGGVGGGAMALMEARYNVMSGRVKGQWGERMDQLGFSQDITGRIKQKARDRWDNLSYADAGMAAGGLVGGIGGGFLGAAAGAVTGYAAGAVIDFVGNGGFNVFEDAGTIADRERIRNARNMDDLEAKAMNRAGILPFNTSAMGRLLGGGIDLDTHQLGAAGVDTYGVAGGNLSSLMSLLGVESVEAGRGTMMAGDQAYRTRDVLESDKSPLLNNVDIYAGKGGSAMTRWMSSAITGRTDEVKKLKAAFNALAGGKLSPGGQRKATSRFNKAADAVLAPIDGIAPAALAGSGGLVNAHRRATLEQIADIDIRGMSREGDAKLQGAVLGSNQLAGSSANIKEELAGLVFRHGTNPVYYPQGRDGAEAMSKRLAGDNEVTRLLMRAARNDSPGNIKKVKTLLEQHMVGVMKIGDTTSTEDKLGIVDSMFSNATFLEGVRELSDKARGTAEGDVDYVSSKGGGGGSKKKKNLRSSEQYQGAFNPIGFGDTESALALINKSLKQTAAMIEKLDAKMRKR